MNEIDRLIEAFSSRGKRNQSLWKLDVLMDLGQIDAPRVVRFLVDIVADAEEPADVRTDALSRLREASLGDDERPLAATAALRVLASASDEQLRLRAAIVLGGFLDVEGVLDALGDLAANPREQLELRYNAFTSLQRAGPSAQCLAILRSLAEDETFGQSARALLTSWRVE